MIVAGDGFEVAETDVAYTVAKDNETERLVTIVDRGNTLMLEGMVSIRQYLAFQNVDMAKNQILENAGMDITTEAGTTYTVPLTYSGWYQGYEEYRAETDGIPAKEMGNSFTFAPFIIVDGVKVYGDSKEFGISHFADKAFKANDEELKTTIVGLLNYGAAAQVYFKYKTNQLMNASLQTYVNDGYLKAEYLDLNWSDDYITPVSEPIEDMTVNFAATNTISDNGKTLFLEGAISIKYYKGMGKSNTNFANASEKTFYFWTEADYNALLASGTPLTKENASYSVDAGMLTYGGSKYGYEYSAKSQQFYAKNLGDALYSALCVTDSVGTKYCSGVEVFSPETFAVQAISGTDANLAQVAKWLVVYGERASIYLAK